MGGEVRQIRSRALVYANEPRLFDRRGRGGGGVGKYALGMSGSSYEMMPQ